MYLYGFHPVREALHHRSQEVERVWIASNRGGRRRREIEELARQEGVELQIASSGRLDEMSAGAGRGVHNGFVAEILEPLETLPAAEIPGGADTELVVLVEDVQDPRNLGALLRVCEGAGVGKVLIRDRGSATLSPTVTKTSAGASEWLNVERIPNTARALEELKERGFWCYGAAAEGKPPWELDLTGKVVLCFGGEQKGLRRLTRERCDELIGLPMKGRVESLNLATAAAAVLYEVVRQRSSP
jgi:23S rRNA (guanosine2251-2'-O)-methyltransferase